MKLRHKLLFVGLVTLVLPWSAWRYLQETERFLRDGQGRALEAMAEVIARSAESAYVRQPWKQGLFVREAAQAPAVDGYAEDWAAWSDFSNTLGERVRLSLAENANSLYLLARVEDPALVYARPNGGVALAGDHLLLTLRRNDAEHLYLISTEAPGWVQAQPLSEADAPRVRGEWQEEAGGYSVELRLPDARAITGLGLAVADVRPGEQTVVGTGGPDDPAAARDLVRAIPNALLRGLAPRGGRLWLVNADGWVLAQAGGLASDEAPRGRWLRHRIYRALLAPRLDQPYTRGLDDLRLRGEEIDAALAGRAASRWQPSSEESTVVAAAAVPVRVDGRVVGAVVAEQTTDALQLFANEAALRLLGSTTLAFGGALLVLFLFASRLSARIRRLRNAAAQAVAPDGRVAGDFPLTRDADELGDLARAFTRAMRDLHEYTDYLRTLSSKLSHELRTPLAVVGSSLDNLKESALPAPAQPYLERARGGVDRLGRILRAMSEASRLEQSLSREEGEPVDLAALVAAAVEGYRGVAPDREFRFELEPGEFVLHGSPELLAQLLDKLVDNAVGFTPPGGWIRLRLARQDGVVELRVANQGPTLPAQMRGRLFDSLVSIRERRSDESHLGLGLYIVRLIAELHRGQARADDLAGGEGVEFTVSLRGMPEAD